jgi:hypothetical protein
MMMLMNGQEHNKTRLIDIAFLLSIRSQEEKNVYYHRSDEIMRQKKGKSNRGAGD